MFADTASLAPIRVVPGRSPLRILADSWTEARPIVQVVFAVRFVVGWALAGAVAGMRPAVGLAGWLLGVVAVYVLNGVTDVAGDRANGSCRPIAAGRLSVAEARAVTAAAGAGAVLTAAALGLPFLLLQLGFLAVGAAYSVAPFRLKDTTAGAAVAVVLLGFLTYLAGAVATGQQPTGILLVFATAMSAWMGGVGAVAKDFSDVRGDAAAGRRTLVIRWGDRRARAAVSASAAAIGIGMLALVAWYPGLLGPAVAVALGAVAVLAVTLRPAPAATGPGRRPYRMFMLTQYAANLTVLALLVV
ncbi:MAG TPA: UbiA family prenyltransferase [Mycobacteriales bacterium]|nr:UbiA family prenyltransferase [Mycobacteriales bacterium]